MWLGLGIRITNWWRTLVASGPFDNHPTLTDGLISVWPLSEDGFDVHGAQDLTNNNTVTFVAKGVGAPANMPETVANFVAASVQNFSFAGAVIDFTTDHTIALWVYTNDTSTYRVLSTGNLPVDIYHAGTTYNASWKSGAINRTAAASNGAWHLVFLMQEGTNYSLGVDGGALSTVVGAANNAATSLRLGVYGDGSTHPLNGKISSPMVWSRALLPSEITDLYAAGDGLFY